jgi:DNA-directed RNA polymerase specialized sigma subunit
MKKKQKGLHNYIYLDKPTNSDEELEIKKAVSELPYPVNRILREYYYKGKPSREIILEMGITRNGFYKYLDKGKYLLRQQLNPSVYENARKILAGVK